MKSWDALIESRIREWQERRARGEDKASPSTSFESFETQLFSEIVELMRSAGQGDSVHRNALSRQAEDLRVRLSIILEKNGLPLMARSLDERIREALERGEKVTCPKKNSTSEMRSEKGK